MATAPAAGGRATIDFFGAQRVARRRTALLVVSFSFAILAVTGIVYLAVLLFAAYSHRRGAPPAPLTWLRPDLLFPTTLGVWGVVGAGSLFHALRLSGGGEAVAEMLGGERVRSDTADPAERVLMNVVEEMAIAAGMPVPRVYVLGREGAINAFAAGHGPDRSVIAVTRGALDGLQRDELQGVVAHELSHVLNADTRLDLRLMAAVGGLSVVAFIGRLLLEGTGRSSRRSGGGQLALFGVALVIAGAIGTFFGDLVRLAVARQREWLADASAVQFTRNPEGLASALRKIAGTGSRLWSPAAQEAAHLFFAEGTSGFLDVLFSTHPPIEERIRRLAPHAPAAATAAADVRAEAPRRAAGVMGLASAPGAGAPQGPGAPDAAARLLRELPFALRQAVSSPFGARAVIAAMLLDARPEPRERQLAGLGALDVALASETARLAPLVDPVPAEQRLAALWLALPALDELSPVQGERLAEALASLAEADGKVTPFEQAVQRSALRRLRGRRHEDGARLRRPDDATMECLELLSTLAWVGGRDAAAAEGALRLGLVALGIDAAWHLLPRERATRAALDGALARLDRGSVELKGRILAACEATARADGRLAPAEAEILRAVAAAFGMPSPPPPRAG